MPANTILRRDAHGDLEMVVEIKPKDSVPPSSKEPYVPIFYRDRSFGAYWLDLARKFIDNVYETTTDRPRL
jgi:hypothetical protein